MIGYFAKQELRVVPASGGPSISLAPAPRPGGGAWNTEGLILYNPAQGPLFQIPAAGGTPAQITQPSRKGERHRGPVFLPDGRHFLFWTWGVDGNFIHISDLETGRIEMLQEGADPVYSESGFLVFWLWQGRNVVVAQRFDPEGGTFSGQPLPLLSGVRIPGGDAALSVSGRTIVFQSPLGDRRPLVAWRGRNGEPLDSLAHRESTWVHRISHDGARVAFGGVQLWVHNLRRDLSELIPTEIRFPSDIAWSPDDSRIVYARNEELRVVQVAGTEEEELLYRAAQGNIERPDWSPDGRTIFFLHTPDETRTHYELWALDLAKSSASLVLGDSYNVFSAQFAPNGKWYAYMSDESGGNGDVYLRPFPGPGAPIRVSVGGGAWPRWRADGKELFYLNNEARLVSVQVEFDQKPSLSRAEVIPGDPITANLFTSGNTHYDVHPDGERFLLRPDDETQSDSKLTILRDWVEMLEERE